MRTTRRKKNPKNRDSVSSLWVSFKQSNIHYVEVQKEKRMGKKLEIYQKKTVKENFPNLVKEIDM